MMKFASCVSRNGLLGGAKAGVHLQDWMFRAVEGTKQNQEVQPLGNNTIGFSVSLLASSGNGLPKTMFINYVPCSLVRT